MRTDRNMDFPASFYGKLDKRNPVITAFERDVSAFTTLMRRVVSSGSRDNSSHAKGIKILVEIWKTYKHRLPLKLYQERMLQISDFLFGIKLYQLALWQGYSVHLLQYNSAKITDITDVDHFMSCFFPEGFDSDQDTFAMKIRAMQGCALCIFEQEKTHGILSQKSLCSLHIYSICRYLMAMNCSAQALEYLLWASISLELSIPLMTAKHLPWIVTLYCAVCHCYYDNQAAAKAEEFARRALGKINDLAKLEEQNEIPATREPQRAYKEASIKARDCSDSYSFFFQLAAMMFKRAVFEARRKPKPVFKIKTKSTLKDIPNAPWPRTTTERMLMGLFDSSAAQFLGILEALWDSTRHPLQTRMPDEPELQEVILELLAAGISILSGVTTSSESLSALTPTSTLMELAITGENKVPIMSAFRFIKLLFQYKQSDAFTELSREMLQVLTGVEGQSFRRAELELGLLDSFNSLLSSQRSRPKEDNTIDDRLKSSFSMSDEFIGLVDTLHKSVCGSAPEVQPDVDLVLDVVLFLWGKVKLVMQRGEQQNLEFTHYLERVDHFDRWLWCLSILCEVALACDLATVDCIMTAEMIHTLAILLEGAAEHSDQTDIPACEVDSDGVKPRAVSLLQSSGTELLQKVCKMVERGLEALAKGVATLLPRDNSAITDSAFMQKCIPLRLLTPSLSKEGDEEEELSKKVKEEVETQAETDIKGSRHTRPICVSLLAADLHLKLNIIHHMASVKLLQLNAVSESELLDRIKKNKVSKALFLILKALLVYNNMEPNDQIKSLLKDRLGCRLLGLPVPVNCVGSPTGQHGLIGLLLQLDGIPYFRCPPPGSGVAATTGTRDLVPTASNCRIDNTGREHGPDSDSMSPASLGICEKLSPEVGVEDLPDRGLGQTFPTDPHNTFGSARSWVPEPKLCVEVSPTISSRYLSTSRTSSGSFPPSEVTFHVPIARVLVQGLGRQSPYAGHDCCPNQYCTGPSWTFIRVEASTLIEKAEIEERKLCISTTPKTLVENKGMKEGEENPPPPPILLSCTDYSFTFAPAPYNLEGQVCWYQLCGRAAEGINQKVRLGDCSLQGTGNMVPAVSGGCILRVEGLEPNQKYVFAVAAYNSQGKLLGNTIGGTTFPLLASMPVPLLSTWAHLAQVAFQAEQYAIAKRACRELWSHFTYPDAAPHSTQDRLATTGLRIQTLERSSPHLCQLFITSIFIETEINIQQGSLYCDSFSDNGPFIWNQEARLTECERMLVAMDLAMWLNDGNAAVQAVASCYGLLAPLIFHQITCDAVVEVLKKCLIVLEENSSVLKQKWTGNTSESLMHMIACITYYLTKALRILTENQMASVVMDCGRRLLQEVYDAQLHIRRFAHEAVSLGSSGKSKTVKGEIKINLQLKALHWKNRVTSAAAVTTDNEISRPLTGCEDPAALYELISSSTLKDAYQDVMKLRRKAYFTEFAVLLLERTMEEGHPDLVLKWGQNIFDFLSRRDELMGQSTKHLEGNSQSKRRSNDSGQAAKGNEPPQQNKTTSHDDTRKKLKQEMPPSLLQKVRTNREMQIVENLLTMMSSVVQRHKKQLQLRNMCCEERAWKSHLNYSMAQAHLALLYQGLDQLHGGALQHSYSQLNPLCFSLAYSGILVRKNSHRQQSSKYEVFSEGHSSYSAHRAYVAAHKDRSKKEAIRADDSEESCEEGDNSSQLVEQQIETHRCTAGLLLDSLNKAALHLRRAMVLAHRGSHWTMLQCVCQTVWDQSCRITVLVQRASQLELPSPITSDQLHTTFTQLLVLATDLIMDMLNRLGLWSLYDSDLTEEELESSLHFSAPLDDSNQVDLRWVRSLVLHTLERLHDSGKWESLAHFAIVFNSYTRERYALIVTPLLVRAQRRLLERISSFGGPAVPQPHHVKTQRATGKEVTYRSYASSQLLSGWTPPPAQQPPICKKAAPTYSTHRDAVNFKGAEIRRSMCLVRVPLDVEDTLSCYHEALDRKPHCLQVFQHSRSLLLLLLTHTQPCFVAQFQHCQSRSLSHSASLVNFSPVVQLNPNVQPYDLTEEDYSTPNALYSLPISPDQMPTVTAAYSTSIKYLQANKHDSLRVLALHEMGNLHFYNGNTRAAHSCWSKAVDCALQTSGVIEKWDGVTFGGGSLQQTLKQNGLWGCLQAAGITAKIAQHILTFDISQRTKCCLLSAHLLKCVLCCSVAQPQADLQYAHHSIGDELFPGVDLFSEPHRLHLGTTVSSLNFLCHWLFSTGYFITLLPILALYLHVVGNVCRDVQRTIEGKILKIRALTELCLFTEAVKESVQLTQGTGVLLPHGHYIAKDNLQPLQPEKTFYSNKSLLDNAEALEELVNCDFAPEVWTLYGSTLCLRFNLARIQLVLALSNTVHGPPLAASVDGVTFASLRSCSVNSQQHKQDTLETEGLGLKTEEPKVLTLDTEREKLTPERIKFLLLEGASSLFQSISQQFMSQSCSDIENLELAVESNLLKANLYLQQGHAARSSEMAISSLVLLQTSPVIMRRSITGSQKHSSELPHVKTRSEQRAKDCSESTPLDGNCPSAVEASERIGVLLWLRCRLVLVQSLAAHIPCTAALFPGKNINEEAARLLQEGLDECSLWGDLDIQALLMVEGAELEAQRGKTDDSMAMLQEAVSLLSGRTCMPPGSSVTLARATLLLSDLRGVHSTTLLQLTQKLLIKQLCFFGQSVVLENGKICFSPSGPSNLYLPYFSLLDQTTLRLAGEVLEGVYAAPQNKEESRKNVEQVLQFISSRHIRMPHISARDIVDGNLKSVMRIILGLAAHFKPSANHRAASGAGRALTRGSASHNPLSTVALAQGAAATLASARLDASQPARATRIHSGWGLDGEKSVCVRALVEQYERGSPEEQESLQPSSSVSPLSSPRAPPSSHSDRQQEDRKEQEISAKSSHGVADTAWEDSLSEALEKEVQDARKMVSALQVVFRSRLDQSMGEVQELKRELLHCKQEMRNLQGVKDAQQQRLCTQEASILQMKQELLRASMAKDDLSNQNAELQWKLEECNRLWGECKKEIGQKDRLLQQLKHKLEESQKKQNELQRDLDHQSSMQVKQSFRFHIQVTLGCHELQYNTRAHFFVDFFQIPTGMENGYSYSGNSAPSMSGQAEEVHLLRDALRSLRNNFRDHDPQQHTLDTLEQGIASLIDRLHVLHTDREQGKSPRRKGQQTDLDTWSCTKVSESHSGSSASTKILYFTGKSPTPSMINIPKRLGEVTLKDVKAAVDREGNYRYHFKALDPEFGTVKEEVFLDGAIIPGWEGKIVAWVEEDHGEER
ncbi:hypothetical protein L3Q82_022233 [Scortum barcoo]|uniref:Uncharacterized protein n=1 Tax=Scortum barcoo TaxID=214431 RepID=A0ACB8X0M3_9TELE|nr:hypothetical protein L3Q82_022233 [Scortum barcoo]